MAYGDLLPAVLPIIIVVVVVILVFVFGYTLMRSKGYTGMGGTVIVRCSLGHLFTTIWIPGISFKAIRLGTFRYQHCPVGHHWSTVELVDPSTLSEAERQFAADHPDSHIP